MSSIVFILSVLGNLLMLYLSYKWYKKDTNELEPKIVFIGLVLSLITLISVQYFSLPPLGKLTVFVKDNVGKIPTDLVNKAQIVASINHKTEKKLVGEDGVVAFDEIPRPDEDSITFELLGVENYELINSKVPYNGKAITLNIHSMCRFCKLAGNVRNQSNYLPNVIVRTGEFVDTTDGKGFFEINIPPDKEQPFYPLTVIVKGKIVWDRQDITPDPKKYMDILIEE